MKKVSEKYFDSVAAGNEEIPEPVRCYPFVLERLKAAPAGSLADIGCGTGEMLQLIRQESAGSYALYGLDISGESLKRAKGKCPDAILTQGDAEHLPYPDGSMDVVLCMHSFHHYPHPLRTLKEMHRVLAPEGRLLLVENLYSFFRRNLLNLEFILRGFPTGDLHMYSRAEIALLAHMAGFHIQEHIPIAHHSQLIDCVKQGVVYVTDGK